MRREQLARFKVTSTPSSLRRWQDRGSRLMPGPATRTSQVCCLLPVFRSVTRRVRGVGPPTVSDTVTARHGEVSTAGVLPLARLPFCHSPGLTGPRGRATHTVTARGVDCAGVLPPASLPNPSLAWPRGRAAHTVKAQCRLCRCAASGPSSVLSLTGQRGRASVTTAGAQRLACFLLVSLPARQVSMSRLLGYQHPERTVSKLCHRRFLEPVDFRPCPCCASAPLPRTLSGAVGFTGAFSFSFFLSCARRPVRAGPGLGPAGPNAGRSPHSAPARRPRPAGDVTAGKVTSQPRVPPGPPAQEPSSCERSAYRCVGGACCYGRKPHSPQHGTASRRCGVVPTRSRVRWGSACRASYTYLSYLSPILPLRRAGGRRERRAL